MTAKPNTLALNARQWRVLMNDHLEVLKGIVGTTDVLDEAGIKTVFHHVDQVRLMAVAWRQSSVPAVVVEEPAVLQPEQIAAAQTNGTTRRGGWPKGKPRKQRMNPAQAVQ